MVLFVPFLNFLKKKDIKFPPKTLDVLLPTDKSDPFSEFPDLTQLVLLLVYHYHVYRDKVKMFLSAI